MCEFFRASQCTKGFKCKFSHDLNVEKKVRGCGVGGRRGGGTVVHGWTALARTEGGGGTWASSWRWGRVPPSMTTCSLPSPAPRVTPQAAKIDLFSDKRDAGQDEEGEEVRGGCLRSAAPCGLANKLTHRNMHTHSAAPCGLANELTHRNTHTLTHTHTAPHLFQGMEEWDQAELERVVKEKHGQEKPSNATSIICKFFLDAVESKKYGW